MKFNRQEAEILERILRWRRDVRYFRTDAIDESVIDELQAAMDLAPSVGNAHPWRVFRVDSPEMRTAVRANFNRCNAEAAADYSGQRQADYLRLKLAGLDAAPLQLAVFTVTDTQKGYGLGRRSMAETLHDSTAMAIHGLWLVARVRNLGLGMVSILDPDAMGRLFDVPEGWQFSAYLCLGYPEFEDDTPLLHRVGWQENHAYPWERL